MQNIILEKLGANFGNNQTLTNKHHPLKGNFWHPEIYIQIGYHFGKNKTYLELSYVRLHDYTIGAMLFFNSMDEAKAFVEKAFNGKIVELAA